MGTNLLQKGNNKARSDGLQLWAAFHPPRGYHVRLAHMVAESSQLSFEAAAGVALTLLLNLRGPLYAPQWLFPEKSVPVTSQWLWLIVYVGVGRRRQCARACVPRYCVHSRY